MRQTERATTQIREYTHPWNTRHISLVEMLAQTDMETAENSCH